MKRLILFLTIGLAGCDMTVTEVMLYEANRSCATHQGVKSLWLNAGARMSTFTCGDGTTMEFINGIGSGASVRGVRTP